MLIKQLQHTKKMYQCYEIKVYLYSKKNDVTIEMINQKEVFSAFKFYTMEHPFSVSNVTINCGLYLWDQDMTESGYFRKI